MRNTAIVATLAASVMATSLAVADTYIYGSDGTSYRTYGNSPYGSDGSSYHRYGKIIYGSD